MRRLILSSPAPLAGSFIVALALAGCGDDSGSSGSGGGAGGGAGTTTASGATESSPAASGATSASGTSNTTGSGSGSTGSASATSASTGAGGSAATFAELCANPGAFFCDAFEGAWDPSWMEDGGDVAVVAGAAVDGEGSTVLQLSTYGDIQSSKLLRTFADVETVHVRFDVQYASGYDNTGGSHGPILGGSDDPPWGMFGTAGIQPNGSDFFVLNFEPMGVVGQGGELGFYAYFVNMQPDGNGDYWGNVFSSTVEPRPVIVPGQWHCAEYALALNAVGTQAGSASFWVDGVHHGTFEGIEWRTDPALRVSTLGLDSYNHMRKGPIPADQPNRVLYDNLVLSTAPVGCLD